MLKLTKYKSLLKKVTNHPININLLISIVALYQTTILNISYYKQVLNILPLDSFSNILFFLSMPIVVFCGLFSLLNLAMNKWLIKIISCLFFIIGATLTYFMLQFEIVIDRGMIQNTFETNLAESTALITPTLIGYITVLGIIPSILVLLVKVKPEKNIIRFIVMRLLSALATLFFLGLIAAFFYKDYSPFFRNNKQLIKYILPFNYIVSSYNQYKYEQYKKLPFIKIGEDALRSERDNQNNKKLVVVLIVGETARSQNFSLNGYAKDTNPRLSKRNDLISLLNASSCGTYTAYSVPCMFSNMERSNYDEKQALRQENVLDILNRVKIDITWLDNDSGSKNVANRIAYEDLTKKYESQNSQLCSDGYCYDQILLDELSEKMKNITNDALIVLHTVGSHGPTYYKRYPHEFKKFAPTCDTNQINACDSESLINTYDNTIVYTDYIIDQSIALLERHNEQYSTALIYLSDHGESLGENGIYLHSLPYSIAPKEQTHIPFIMWLSDSFQQYKHVNYDCLKSESKQNAFSQDNLFHTLLGVFDVKTKEYNGTLDILGYCKKE